MPQHEVAASWEPAADVPTPELLAAVEALLANVELIDIRPCSISASVGPGVSPGTSIGSVEASSVLQFAADEGLYGSRFDFRFVMRGESDDVCLGTIEFSILLDYEVADGFLPDRDAADFVTSTTGYFAAFPYARELFQALSGRLQLDPVVLGLLKRGSISPGSVSVVPRHMLGP
jgi:hypothetical protein